jgi:hypothetical protein
MNPRPFIHDRRTFTRVALKGTTILRSGSFLLRGRIANLSRSGVCTNTRTTAPERLLGAQVEIMIRLDAGDSAWLECKGRVVRIGATSMAMVLEHTPSGFDRLIDEMHAVADRNDHMISVVLVDEDIERRRSMAQAFRDSGCLVIEAATPLEAIVRLGEADFEPHLIAVADSLASSVSEELRRFVQNEHPRTMLVAIGRGPDAPHGTLHWLSSSDLANDLDDRVRAVLSQLARQ